jgi:pimeloyl-ACP methyl ester carboxylesterase
MKQKASTLQRLHGTATASNRRTTAFGVATLFLFLSSCSTVKVKTNSNLVSKAGLESAQILGKLAGAPLAVLSEFGHSSAALLESARRHEVRGRHTDAAGDYLKAAVDAHVLLATGTESRGSDAEKALIEVHNTALARFAELWVKDPRRLEPGPYHLMGGSEDLRIELSANSTYHRGYFDRFVAAKAVQEEGIVRKVREGYGAPIVGIREQTPERAEEMEFYPPQGLYTPVTVTMDSVRKSGDVTHVSFSMRNPMVEETFTVGPRRLALAADYSAPMAVILKGRNEALSGLEGFFQAEERIEQSGVYLMEPYDPDRIPVLLIHGLISVPMIWRDIVPEMISDPEISRRYQFMVFTYPSSYPLVESAALLRDELAALRAKYDPDGNDALSRNMVVAGHSMGGMLTHTLVADIGDNLWKQFSDTPLDEVPIGEAQREDIRRLVYFDPDPAVRRAVYFSAPHRGAYMATKDIAGTIAKLAKLPVDVMRINAGPLDPRIGSHFKIPIGRKYTSRESLEPGAPMVAAMDISPYKKGVIYHSIMGDRGKGDTPNSSDGVVEYWSSRQEGAASELIVPTDHGSYKHPRAIEEFRRILRLHAGI